MFYELIAAILRFSLKLDYNENNSRMTLMSSSTLNICKQETLVSMFQSMNKINMNDWETTKTIEDNILKSPFKFKSTFVELTSPISHGSPQ